MEFRLDSLRPGMTAVVTGFYCPENMRQRLADLGMVEGTTVACRYRSPGGTVTALHLRGTTLAIRRELLAQIAARQV